MNNKNDKYYVLTNSKDTVPASATLMGTISTVGKEVIGSNEVTYDTLVGAFVLGTTVTDTTSGATGIIIADNGSVLTLANITGLFSNNDVLTATGATALVNGTPNYTRFGIDCNVGDWIVDLTQDEIRKITSVGDIHTATIDSAFTVDLAVATALVVVKKSPMPREISVLIPAGNGNGALDGQTLYAGVGVNASKMSRERGANTDGIDPIIVDATTGGGTIATVQINY